MALNSDEGWAYEQREIHGARSGTPYSRMHGTPRSGQEASDTLHIVLHRAFDLDLSSLELKAKITSLFSDSSSKSKATTPAAL